MTAIICLILSIAALIGSCAIWACIRRLPYKARTSITFAKCLITGAFLAGVLIHFPMYYGAEGLPVLKSLLASVHHTLRTFILDGELQPIQAYALTLGEDISPFYELYAMLLYLVAPILTFGAVLSLIKNVSAYRRLLMHQFSETFIFSELNEQSVALANSLRANHPRGLMVFTDVYETDNEEVSELCGRARELNAVLLRSDIAALNLRLHKSNHISFYIIGSDESENVQQSLSLIEQYRNEKKMRLFVFSTSVEGELLFQASFEGGMSVRRVNIVRSLINQTLYQNGIQLFQNAVPSEGGEKVISVVLVGLGQYGTEMLKALCWCGQMDGYRIEIDVFDIRMNAEKAFAAQCPELLKWNDLRDDGEAEYKITIHSGVNVNSIDFEETLQKLPRITHVFVALGSDVKNLQTSVRVREFCERQGQKPVIQAIIQDPRKVRSLSRIVNFKGVPYGIDFIGDLDTCYSEEVVLNSELEREALERHLKWGEEKEFWAFEYNYRSSVASAIHQKLRVLCDIPGAKKPIEERTEEERTALAKLEHRRWNAFMRGEGYRYSGSREKSSRNDLAKLHNDLIPFDELSPEEKTKDDI